MLPGSRRVIMVHANGLYATLLADSWAKLDPVIQRFHTFASTQHATGGFRVEHGKSWFVRMLARLAGLPGAADAVDVQLAVVTIPTGEEWRRSFAGKPMVSTQSAHADGRLVERVGLSELRFRLAAQNGGLRYETTGCALRLGPLRLPLPLRLSPRVTASEQAAPGGDRIDVVVEMHLPLLGLLIRYGGQLTLGETPLT
jgi:hypothetical protein